MWKKKELNLELLKELSRSTMVEHLGIQFSEIDDDYLVAVMKVNHATHQPLGQLHGGASVALAETVGSMSFIPGFQPQSALPSSSSGHASFFL